MLRKKNITLNGKKSDGSNKLKEGDVVNIFFSDETYEKFSGEKKDDTFQKLTLLANEKAYNKLSILYEDEEMVVVNKPSGLLSQKAQPGDVSANELFLAYLIDTNQLSEEEYQRVKPSVANRLDRNTSGLLLCGKTTKKLQELSLALKERTVKKYYICLVKGEIKEKKTFHGYLKKDEATNKVTIFDREQPDAKYIKTAYEPLSYNGKYTKLKVHLITGRSHQIRAHLAYLGHPILGDYKYGEKAFNNQLKSEYGVTCQMLHSYEMIFDDGLHIKAPLPKLYNEIMGETL